MLMFVCCCCYDRNNVQFNSTTNIRSASMTLLESNWCTFLRHIFGKKLLSQFLVGGFRVISPTRIRPMHVHQFTPPPHKVTGSLSLGEATANSRERYASNQLSLAVRQCTRVNQFKVALKTHLFTDYYFDTMCSQLISQLFIHLFYLICYFN